MSIKEYYQRRDLRKAKRMEKAALLGLGPDNSVLRGQINDLWSIIIRRRDNRLYDGWCRICLIKYEVIGREYGKIRRIEQGYHIVPRGDDAVRWLLINGVGSCGPCNYGEKMSRERESSRMAYREIHVALIGEPALKEIERLANTTIHFAHTDLLDKREEFRRRIRIGDYT